MLYLALAVLSSALVSVFMHLSEKTVKNQMFLFTANYVVCTGLSAAFLDGGSFTGGQPGAVIGLGAVSGVLYLLSFWLLRFNMGRNGIVLSATFMKLGLLVPILLAVLVFGEAMGALRIAGFALALGAILLMQLRRTGVRADKNMLWLPVLLVGAGTTDAMANIFTQLTGGAGQDGYLVVTFCSALVCALVCGLIGGGRPCRADLVWGALIGIPNYFSSRFLLLALERVDAVVTYPVYSAGTLVVITLVGVAAFKERLDARKTVALGMILLALVLLNL